MKSEFTGTLLAIFTALISGFAIIANKIFIVNLNPIIFTSIRALLIGIIFLIISSFQCKFDYKKFKKVKWEYLIAIGFIGGALAFLLFFSGLKLTTGGRAAFIHKTLPVYITILAVLFLKEKVTTKQIFALIIMLLGLLILISTQITTTSLWSDPSLGDLLVVFATILWAVENIIAKHAMIKGESNFVVTFARMFIGSVFLFLSIPILGNMYLLFNLTLEQATNIILSTVILLGYVLFWYWSIKHINVSKASTILLLAPVISLIFGVVLLNEPVPTDQLLGSALILIGAYFVVKIKSEFATGV